MATERSATATIRGYLYQTVLAAQTWLDLGDGEALVVEGDEDFDRLVRGEQTSVQVKHRQGEVGLHSESVHKALAAFARAYALRADTTLRFVYVSTEGRRAPGRDFDPLAAWVARNELALVAAAVAELADEHGWAVPWPEGRADWSGFVDAVRFELEKPTFTDARVELQRRLEHDPRTRDVFDVGVLAQRLLDDLLTASATDDRDLRRRTRADLEKLVDDARQQLAGWARGPRAKRLVGWMDAVEKLGSVLWDGTRDLERPERPSQLLDPSYRVVPFLEDLRQAELSDFARWCDEPARVAVRVVVGAGGTGKTRLFLELSDRRRHAGWHAGFVPVDATAEKVGAISSGLGDRLVVVDYAETRLDVTRSVLLAAVRSSARCRVVLLAREPGPWLQSLAAGGHDEGELLAAEPLRLHDLTTDAETRRMVFPLLVAAFAAATDKKPSQPPVELDLADPSLDLALMLAMSALEASEGRAVVGTFELLEATLVHEGRFWVRWLEQHGVRNHDDRARWAAAEAVAALTLRGGFGDQAEVSRVLRGLPSCQDPEPDVAPKLLASMLENLYGEPRGLQPDVLGEHVVMRALERAHEAEAWLGAALAGAGPKELENAFIVLGRLGARLSEPSPGKTDRSLVEQSLGAAIAVDLPGRALPALAAAQALGTKTASAPVADALASKLERTTADVALKVGWAILGELDKSSITPVSLRRLGVVCGLVVVQALRAKPDHDSADVAHTLDNLSVRLSELGRLGEALAVNQEAVSIYRTLARARAFIYLPELAQALNNLGNRLAEHDLLEDALRAQEEAVEIYRALARAERNRYQPLLAMALINLGNRLSAIGRRDRALAAHQEAERIYSELSRERPGELQVERADCLSNLGLSFIENGRQEDGVAVIEKAVAIYRDLARAHPDTFAPRLSEALRVLGLALLEAAQAREATSAFEEGLRLVLPMARQLPAAFEELSLSLTSSLKRASAEADREVDSMLLAEVEAIYDTLSSQTAT